LKVKAPGVTHELTQGENFTGIVSPGWTRVGMHTLPRKKGRATFAKDVGAGLSLVASTSSSWAMHWNSTSSHASPRFGHGAVAEHSPASSVGAHATMPTPSKKPPAINMFKLPSAIVIFLVC
jgi:hypothetical protein